MKDTVWSLLAAIFVITMVFMLVRPGSPASVAIGDIGNALANLTKTAVSGPAPTGTGGTTTPPGTSLD
jgi:hypothetical protein